MWQKFWQLLQKLFGKEPAEPEEVSGENPFIPELRPILEEILRQYGKNYREFRPVLIDREEASDDASWISFPRDAQMETVMEQITPNLNYLTVVTNRPEYFYVWRDKLYQEEGLLVSICEKEKFSQLDGYNTVLDFEREGAMYPQGLRENFIYIPFYKRPWKIVENIDIEVPIGYNIKIVERNWLAGNEVCMSVNEEQ